MATGALQAFRQTVTVAWPKGQATGARRHLVAVARAGHERIMATAAGRSGFRPGFEAYANRPGQTNLDAVILPGPIVYRYRYLREIIIAAIALLQKASPVRSRRYRDGHTLFVDGVPTLGNVLVPGVLRPGQQLFIANPVPYARRLEVGKTESGRSFVVQVAPHIYERVVRQLRARFGNVATIEFDYVTIPGAHQVKGRLPTHYTAKGGVRRRRRPVVGSGVRSPAVIIR